ncbi:shikimate kinase AroL [Xenorhabdus nematophila]|uniref:Shikimate kinase 1 n=1 Tax=Xenorhabdus nematophila (strain ATCC 19061 / DSM 3370 / CCUG 14189 / LMG 1036 / NCIMB 9965 / AN6) TaxID=406817 RepID=D3V9U0_XENNA|nr:shikimate kinase AroL [Xenorhabdus nematophila]CEE95038.1 shikimate kinase II [Xenorhabdus nematophila str. Anatoliense]CBJ89328.1 shikimate kinase II [Xenorhabdus nematophila ATCC 19061]CCW30090.1 Shikimate kinase 2 [Xenorhabdus nematophila F1]CEE95360.1 shikimate kinase II [Xenorhabdus nematophila str. Anatoliense]CEK22228.1 shikimate kinase II [Xenorhabdus nematophila AN6/1]
MKQALFIVGARGAGKTTIGKLLAEILSYKFIDTDESLQISSKMTIADLVALHGWEYFRQLESQTLKTVSQSGCVISTGGGMVLSQENRHYMQQHGIVIYLQTSAEVLSNRLSLNPENSQRPSLTGKSIIEEIEDILVAREPLYSGCADLTVDASLSKENIVTSIKNYILTRKNKII